MAQILLQILEDGRLTDSLGRKVDFRNTILIMTSNIGAHILQKNIMGFSIGDADQDFENTKDKILDEAKKSFKPEFLNRLTELVIFRPLAKDSMHAIVELELDKVSERLKEKKLKLSVSDEAKQFLIEKGYDEKFGARPLRRAVERYLEDNLAEALLSGNLRKNKPIKVLISDDEEVGLKFEQTSGKKKVSVSSPTRKIHPKKIPRTFFYRISVFFPCMVFPMQKTLVLLKPDCLEMGLAGQVISRFENKGYSICASKMIQLDDVLLNEHYSHVAHLPFFPEIAAFMSSCPVMALVIQGDQVIQGIRDLLGPTDSTIAPKGTIRGDLGTDRMKNVVHASDSEESAQEEISRFLNRRKSVRLGYKIFLIIIRSRTNFG